MTKRRPKKHDDDTESPMYAVVDGGVVVGPPYSAPVHVVDREITEDTCLALMEQAFEMMPGPDNIARWLASKLREKSPNREFLNMVALMLDPKVDSYFKLIIGRRRSGKTWTRRANDAALVKAITKYERESSNKRGSRKAAIGKVADLFGVSEHTVRAALRNLNSK